LQFYYNIILDT